MSEIAEIVSVVRALWVHVWRDDICRLADRGRMKQYPGERPVSTIRPLMRQRRG